MFIFVDIAIAKEKDYNRAELIGKEEFDDDEVYRCKARINVDNIVTYARIEQDPEQSEITTVDGSVMYTQNSPEEIDEMIKNRLNSMFLLTRN
ncbi:MAG TPA: hypothetical protein VLA13_08765 [Massilibacterium sp.]|nr:hypothetical protein [Massilibacterium sp.]